MAVLAAPLVIPFAEALGLSVAILGMDKASDKVNQFIKDNPEESMKIFQMIMPAQGIANVLKNKSSEEVEEKISLEDLEGMSDEEAQDLSKEDKAELMKQAGKSGSKDKRQTMIDISEKLGLSGEGKDKQDIEYEIDERYDEGGVEEVSKPKFDYKKFFKKRYADGGAIGIEVLFEEKKPRKDFNTGGRATTQDFANALKSVSAGTTYQQQRQAKDYARQEASNLLSQAMKSGNQSGIQSILQGIGGSTTIPGMQFNRSGNRITSVPATGPGRNAILNAMANQMLSTTSYAAPDPFQKRVDELDAIRAENQRLVNQYIQNNPPSIGITAGPMGGTPQAPGKPAYEDKTLLSQLTKLTPLQSTYFDPFDQLSDIDQYNVAQAFPQLQSQLRNKNFVSSSGPLGKQQIFERIYGLKDGGRVGLFMGGPALEGQALNIYNSMNSYGFTDQQIADALQGQGLYTPSNSTPPETTTSNIINQQIQSGGGGGGGITTLDPLTRPKGTPFNLNSLTKTKFGYNNALGRTIEGVKDFTGSMIDKFSGSKVGEGITTGATKFKNFAITPMMALMQKRNPLNPSATNYNPNLQKQMDFLEGTTGTRVFGTSDNLQFEDAAMIGRDPNSGLAKYGPGSVLSGQNVVSGFGTNDYEQQLANYISKMRTYKNLTNFQKEKLEQAKAEVAKEIARREQETADRARAANPGVYASADRQGFTDGKGGGFGSKSTGTNDAFGNKSGRGRTGYSEGGLATMFKEKR
jgi:hypothetical protein